MSVEKVTRELILEKTGKRSEVRFLGSSGRCLEEFYILN
jgi:hypothetical protein